MSTPEPPPTEIELHTGGSIPYCESKSLEENMEMARAIDEQQRYHDKYGKPIDWMREAEFGHCFPDADGLPSCAVCGMDYREYAHALKNIYAPIICSIICTMGDDWAKVRTEGFWRHNVDGYVPAQPIRDETSKEMMLKGLPTKQVNFYGQR